MGYTATARSDDEQLCVLRDVQHVRAIRISPPCPTQISVEDPHILCADERAGILGDPLSSSGRLLVSKCGQGDFGKNLLTNLSRILGQIS